MNFFDKFQNGLEKVVGPFATAVGNPGINRRFYVFNASYVRCRFDCSIGKFTN